MLYFPESSVRMRLPEFSCRSTKRSWPKILLSLQNPSQENAAHSCRSVRLIEDARHLPQGYILNTEICIIGAGAAGITSALELAGLGKDVALLEAGGWHADSRLDSDLDGEIVSPGHHAPLAECRSRQLGGTTALWVGRCLPLDPIDLEKRPHVPYSGWPIGWQELESHYPRANHYCHTGPYAYEVETALPQASKSLIPGLKEGVLITNRLERWSLPTRFGRHHRGALNSSQRIRVLLNATCTRIALNPRSRIVESIVAASKPGRLFQVRAQAFVLAAGGLETTRLLMTSKDTDPKGIGNRYDLLGRFYMGHVFGSAAVIQFLSNIDPAMHGFERDAEGVYCRRRIWLSPENQRKEGLLNTVFWTSNTSAANPDHCSGILSAAYIALSLPGLRDKLAPLPIRQMFLGKLERQSCWPHLRNIARNLPQTSAFGVYYLYKRLFARRRIPALFVRTPTNRYDLSYHAEQAPDRNSRVTLSDAVDRFGIPKLRVDLRYSKLDVDSVVRAHEVLAAELHRQGIAAITYKRDEVHSHVLEQAADGYHQIGTTRMAASERDGVVNEDCRVHGVKNLYVCSSSVFPTSGHANPTLTIVALAVRLAHYLAGHSRPNPHSVSGGL
jgi:choline dehydrogenase-like flavoprotein